MPFAAIILIVLAGEPVHFDAALRPQFTSNQVKNSAESTRAGLARWAATPHGQQLLANFSGDCKVRVTEDPAEDGAGRAPQPGIATLVAAADHSKLKTYDLVLNPMYFRVPDGMIPLPNQPATPADMMAAAWAAEMLHIHFYLQGISLPHHQRADFQREWRAVAMELGMPALTHDDDDARPSPRKIVLSSLRGR